MTTPVVRIDGELAVVDFDRFDLASYQMFQRTKALPESRVSYDWRADRYQVTTPARFAPRLGGRQPIAAAFASLPFAPHLFDYQAWALKLALDARRFALWLDCGLGKTAIYLEWARQVHIRTGGRILVLAPLGILPQIAGEMERFYPNRAMRAVILKSRDELIAFCQNGDVGVVGLCNYEKLNEGEIPEFRLLAGLVADESSMLKTGGGVRKWNLIKSAKGIEYKLSCTATPAPNDAMEYASQAAFLETIRHEGEILWTFFHKNGKSNKYTVKPHAQEALYRFMASWSLYMRDPAAFGFADILATLPAPIETERRCDLTNPQRSTMMAILAEHGTGMFADDGIGVTVRTKLAQLARGFQYRGKAKGRTIERIYSDKVDDVTTVACGQMWHKNPVLIWTSFDEEGVILQESIQRANGHQYGEVGILTGETPEAKRLEMLDRFREGAITCLISKPQLIGFGLNLQHVRCMIFSGLDDSYERRYQAVRRAYRLGQTHAVDVFIPYVPELEGLMFENVRQKEARFLAEVAAQEALYRVAMADELEAVA